MPLMGANVPVHRQKLLDIQNAESNLGRQLESILSKTAERAHVQDCATLSVGAVLRRFIWLCAVSVALRRQALL